VRGCRDWSWKQNSLYYAPDHLSVMPWPQTAPVRFTHLKSRPSVTFAAALQQLIAVLTQREPERFGCGRLAAKVENDPSFIALLESFNLEFGEFRAA